ncbi:ISKra4 family transposase [Moorena bouillonii]|uniref:ISKra4 family transposase n=1 Tax=Moorena bouillonii PNG TaxID=568701 RepID=A0A1U7N6B7_9CYAN|nr:ISKra4 family transposase [Moorena bouillonii]NEQ86608.1 ISKra4 family transposase [Moorena sp. SIO2I5]OLT61482.1 hypothetical protein BJP37_23200 [Moorena bouillonii PNG]
MLPTNQNKDGDFTEARELFEEMVTWLSSESSCGLEHSELENNLFVNGNELLRRLLQGYLDKRKSDEIESDCIGSDGVKRTHKRHQSRKLKTIFGIVIVNRLGYGGRGIHSLNPLDGELNLPPEQYSHGLSERVATSVAFNGYNQTVDIINKTTAAKVAKRQVEELALSSSRDFEEFYQAQQAQYQLGEKTGDILVISVDGKGVVMRQEDLRPDTKKRAAGQKKLQKRLTKGEKRNSKPMATVAAVYTIEPIVRTATQIVNPPKLAKIKRPRPEGKRVWASLAKEAEQVINETFDEALSRDRERQKKLVALVDGNKTQLRRLDQLAKKHKIQLTIVLDLIHVIEYLWKAAFVFHAPSSKEAEDWVSDRLLRILEGKSSYVASGMRRCATRLQLKPEQRSAVDKCANYLLNNRDYLRYDLYLAEGFPVATGVIEGACRHLIKDRMDITGARWSLQGAEAVLRLRSLHVSGDWNDYWRFHLQKEHHRNHQAKYFSGIPLLKSVIQASICTNTSYKAMVF